MFVSNSGRWKDHQIRRWSNQSHGSDICHTRWVLPLKRRWLGHWHCWKARCFPTPCRVLAISSICFRRHQRFQKDAMLRCYSQRRGSKVKWYGVKKQGKWGRCKSLWEMLRKASHFTDRNLQGPWNVGWLCSIAEGNDNLVISSQEMPRKQEQCTQWNHGA